MEKKNIQEFDNIGEIIDYLNSNENIKVEISSEEWWSGFYQLKNDSESDNITHKNLYDDSGEEILSVNKNRA